MILPHDAGTDVAIPMRRIKKDGSIRRHGGADVSRKGVICLLTASRVARDIG